MASVYPPPDTFDIVTPPQSADHKKRRQSIKRQSVISTGNGHPDRFRVKNFEPKEMKCPHCHKHITTKLTYEVGDSSWSWCCCFTLFGCLLGCCLLPFCVDRFKDVVHNCPECNHRIKKYSRSDFSDHRKV